MQTMASSSKTSSNSGAPKSPESFESLDRRNAAAEILQSYEKLSWFSFQRCESLAQTRQHFENIVAGFTDEDEAALVDVKEDTASRRAKDGDQDKDSRRKGKKRLSSGDGGASGSAMKAGKA